MKSMKIVAIFVFCKCKKKLPTHNNNNIRMLIALEWIKSLTKQMVLKIVEAMFQRETYVEPHEWQI